MNRKYSLSLAIVLFLLGCWLAVSPTSATVFGQQEVNQPDFIAIARPYGGGKYDLLILQQLPGKRQCWSVNGADPGVVQPLLLDFDFTGSCERATDSNGYSIRIDGKDYGLDYLLRVVDRGDELFLVASPRDSRQKDIIVGRTRGKTAGLLQIYLVEGWRFTKRVFEGRTLTHVYLTGEGTAIASARDLVTEKERSPQEETPKPADPQAREYTFTAPDTGKPPQATPSERTPEPPKDTLPPPPNPSNLPPLTPPVSGNPGATPIVPPPPPRNVRNRGTLSDVLTFNASPPANRSQPASDRFKVMILARTDGDRSRVRSLYPDAFRTSYRGKSFLQIGVFTSREKAESALQSLAPLSGSIVPF